MFLYYLQKNVKCTSILLSSSKSSNECPTPTEISAIVPVYNQAGVISYSLSRIREALFLTNLNFEIIVVNDGSSDNTLAILEREKGNDSKMKIVS
jgi:cellulose synthase/poly-beta-1,6-N-acetylglucosamine synthase-like glycosyltransferase